MKKYLAILDIQIQNSFQYRAQLFFWILQDSLFIVAMFYVWRAIFGQRAEISQYTFPSMITYYVTSFLVRLVTTSFNEYNMEDLIKDGRLNKYIVRPMSFFWYRFSSEIGWKLSRIFVTVPLYAAILFLLRHYLVFPPAHEIWKLIPTLIASSSLYFLVSYLVSYLAFWMIKIESVVGIIRGSIIPLFAGSIIPLDLFPDYARAIAQFLPFQYLIYFPVKVFLGQVDDRAWFVGIIAMVAWIAALFVVVQILWPRALKKYESVGG